MPLSGLRVVDLTRILAGPFCSMLLANMGVHVIKIETPGEGDPVRRQGVGRYGLSWYFAGFNRNKRSLTLNLRHHEGCTVLEKLIAGSDVLGRTSAPAISAVDAFWWPLVRASARRGGGLIALLAGAGAPRWRCLHGEVGIAVGWVGWDEISGKASVSTALVNLWVLNHSSRARRISATRCVRPVPLFRGQFEKDGRILLAAIVIVKMVSSGSHSMRSPRHTAVSRRGVSRVSSFCVRTSSRRGSGPDSDNAKRAAWSWLKQTT